MSVEAFLKAQGWAGATRHGLAGDASARHYTRLMASDGSSAILMQDNDDVARAAFQRAGQYLISIGLTAPRLLATDPAGGFLLLEDFGDTSLASLLDAGSDVAATGYTAAASIPRHLAQHRLPDWAHVPASEEISDMVTLTLDRLQSPPRNILPKLAGLLVRHADGPPVLSLRDYHAENLMWLPRRDGLNRLGLLDFQDAVALPDGYDLASLVDDPRRVVPLEWRDGLIREHAERTGTTFTDTKLRIDLLSLLRNLRILGIFDRLASDHRKPRYRFFVPRTWELIDRAASNPALADLAPDIRQIREQTTGWAKQ